MVCLAVMVAGSSAAADVRVSGAVGLDARELGDDPSLFSLGTNLDLDLLVRSLVGCSP